MRMQKPIRVIFIVMLAASFLYVDGNGQQRHRHRYHGGAKASDGGLNIVCSFSDYATIANFLTGGNATITHISHGDQDPHFVPPKPSFAMMLRKADMWITTGMDLEQWSSTLLDKARNKYIMDGEIGFVSASDGIQVLDKVDKADRTEGDIHMMGNPHINTGPLNWKIIAQNIAIGLCKVDPDNAEYYAERRDLFIDKVDRALFGDELVDMFGGKTLGEMLLNHTLFTFLDRDYKGAKLSDKLGGWLKKALPFRDANIIAYHKNWSYFVDTFGLNVVGFVELKPGIPPSAKHVQQTIRLIKEQKIKAMLVASYFEKKTPSMIEGRTGVKALFLPLSVKGVEGVDDNFQLIDYWIDQVLQTL